MDKFTDSKLIDSKLIDSKLIDSKILNVRILRVEDIDWSDKNMARAGVIPFYKDKGQIFLGIGISRTSSSQTFLGGKYEKEDWDLLATAVREYNEEVGNNLPTICEEDLYGRYAVMNEESIQVLLPVDPPKEFFKSTKEIYNMLWITPGQLRIIQRNQDFMLPNSKTKIWSYSPRFSTLVKDLPSFLESEAAFERSEKIIPRRERKICVARREVTRSFGEFSADIADKSLFTGLICVVCTSDKIGIITQEETIYILDNNEQSQKEISKCEIEIIVSLEEDIANFHSPYHVTTGSKLLFDKISGESKDALLLENFLNSVKLLRQEEPSEKRIIDELRLLNAFERHAFENYPRVLFMRKRAGVLSMISYLNLSLPKEGTGFGIVKENSIRHFRECRNDICRDIHSATVLNELLAKGFFKLINNLIMF